MCFLARVFGLGCCSCEFFMDFFIVSQYSNPASSTSIFLLCSIIVLFFFMTRSPISASCRWVCKSKHRCWASDICDFLVNEGDKTASTTDGCNSRLSCVLTVVVANDSVPSSSISIQ